MSAKPQSPLGYALQNRKKRLEALQVGERIEVRPKRAWATYLQYVQTLRARGREFSCAWLAASNYGMIKRLS